MLIVPTGARGHYKIQCNARWQKKCYFSLNMTDFNKLFFKVDQKIEPKSIFRV